MIFAVSAVFANDLSTKSESDVIPEAGEFYGESQSLLSAEKRPKDIMGIGGSIGGGSALGFGLANLSDSWFDSNSNDDVQEGYCKQKEDECHEECEYLLGRDKYDQGTPYGECRNICLSRCG